MTGGRKFRALLVGLAAEVGGLLWVTWWPAALPAFSAYAAAVVALVMGFVGSHVVSEWTPAARQATNPEREP